MARSPVAFNYGPSIGQLLSGRSLSDPYVDNLEIDDPDALAAQTDASNPAYMQLRLKKKKQAAMIKQILVNGGYGDLARMTNLHKGEV
jgi:hypothetical protein